jgi:uncharacterized protein (DUF1919 family)
MPPSTLGNSFSQAWLTLRNAMPNDKKKILVHCMSSNHMIPFEGAWKEWGSGWTRKKKADIYMKKAKGVEEEKELSKRVFLIYKNFVIFGL